MRKLATLFVGLSAALAGCTTDDKIPPATSADTPATWVDADRDSARKLAADVGGLQVDPEIARACDLPTTYFAFDSAQLESEANDPLGALATCFASGPMAGKRLRLVGHADPRGELHYNFALGQRRAASVKKHLVTRGVEEDRIETSSMGELEATGHDESTWARDRRVDVLLDG